MERYTDIEHFKEYEMIQCIAFEITIRTEKFKQKIQNIIDYFHPYQYELYNFTEEKRCEIINNVYEMVQNIGLLDERGHINRNYALDFMFFYICDKVEAIREVMPYYLYDNEACKKHRNPIPDNLSKTRIMYRDKDKSLQLIEEININGQIIKNYSSINIHNININPNDYKEILDTKNFKRPKLCNIRIFNNSSFPTSTTEESLTTPKTHSKIGITQNIASILLNAEKAGDIFFIYDAFKNNIDIETIKNEIERYRANSIGNKKLKQTISKASIKSHYFMLEKHINTWSCEELLLNAKHNEINSYF